jgi:hypothetical protein
MIALQEIEEELNRVVNDGIDYTKVFETMSTKRVAEIGLLTQFLGGVSVGIELSHKARKMDPIQSTIDELRTKIKLLEELLYP